MPFETPLSVTFTRGAIQAVLNAPLRYYDAVLDIHIVVPAGFVTDFGSVPGYVVLPGLVPKIGILRDAFILHDWLYYTGMVSRKDADRILREAAHELIEHFGWVGVVLHARMWLAYLGVRLVGWHVWGKYREAEGDA